MIHEFVADRFVLSEIEPLIDRVSKLPEDEGYAVLKEWVLPNEVHRDYRMQYKFPRRPRETFGNADFGRNRSMNCPAAMLVELAMKVGKIDELVSEITQNEPQDSHANKSKNAILFLASIAQQDDANALKNLTEVFTIIDKLDTAIPEELRAPEMVVGWHAAARPELQVAARDIGRKLEETLTNRASAIHRARVKGIRGRVDSLRLSGANGVIQPSKLIQWAGIPKGGSPTAVAGRRNSHWHLSGRGILDHVPGELTSHLMFQSPLQGSFEIHADMTTQAARATFLTYGMRGSLPQESGNPVQNKSVFGARANNTYLQTVIPNWSALAHFKIEIEDSTIRTFVNGVQVHEQAVEGMLEPWLMLHPASASNRSGVRNLRIVGEPTIPDEIDLTETDMAAWHASRFGEGFSTNKLDLAAAWIKDGDELQGRVLRPSLDPDTSGKQESLLTYHRPFLEDGEFEYESFYQEGKFDCHATVGGSTFLVRSDGVWIREISDQRWDDVGLNSDATRSKKIEGSKPVELKNDDWNKFVIRLTGNQLTMLVNDAEVLQYEIDDPLVKRQFGFFRFADKFEARIRRIKYRGQWPKILPPVEDQELAYPTAGVLAAGDATISKSLVVDLTRSQVEIEKDGLKILGPADHITESEQGLVLKVENASEIEGWPGFSFPNPVEGDFDATINFSELNLGAIEEGWGLGFDLEVEMDDPTQTIVAIGIQGDKKGKQFAKSLLSHQQPNDVRAYEELKRDDNTESGRLRLSRRGRQIHCLFAP